MGLRQFFTSNAWWGKIIGAFLGFLTAGPTGALLGILVGNFFDRGLVEHFSNLHEQYHAEKDTDIQDQFLESTFLLMGHIAKADGRVSEQEIQMAKTIMDEFKLNAIQKKTAQHWFNTGKSASFNIENTVRILQNKVRNNSPLLKLFLDIQYRMALVDGLSVKKQSMLNSIFKQMGFAPLHEQHRYYKDFQSGTYDQSQYRSSSNRNRSYSSSNQQNNYSPRHTLDHAYSLLGTSPTASKQDIKRAYRRQMSRNHPDKLAAQGLSDEHIKAANEKTQKIRQAYEQICASKGW